MFSFVEQLLYIGVLDIGTDLFIGLYRVYDTCAGLILS
jgi:hypothetical protein